MSVIQGVPATSRVASMLVAALIVNHWLWQSDGIVKLASTRRGLFVTGKARRKSGLFAPLQVSDTSGWSLLLVECGNGRHATW
jgi:hypothetical protein